MSWPHGDEPGSGGDSAYDNHLGRPTSLENLAVFRNGRPVRITPEHVQRSLRLPGTPFENLPQLPPFAPLFRYTTEWHKLQVASVLVETSLVLGRVVTPPEADAIAYYRSKYCARLSWSGPLVLASSAYMVYRGRDTYRFPFFTPKPASFNPSVFPAAGRPLLTGAAATNLWHGMRFGAYWLVCQIVIKAFVASYAHSTYLVSVLQDDRLKAMREQLVRDQTQARQQRPGGIPPRQQPPAGTAAPPALPASRPADPMAPHERPQPQAPQQHEPWTQPAPAEPQPPAQYDDGYLFDDASPVAPSQRPQPQRTPGAAAAPPADGTSAWDRVRQRAKAAEAGAPADQGVHDSGAARQPRTEQYTFAPADQEKAYAKEQAQKEFDEMLERERRGLGGSGWRSG